MVRGAAGPEHVDARTRGARTSPHGVTLDARQVTERYRVAAQRTMSPRQASAPAIVWTDEEAELLIRPGDVRVSCRKGLLLITVPVFTDQTGDDEVVVAFAVGGA